MANERTLAYHVKGTTNAEQVSEKTKKSLGTIDMAVEKFQYKLSHVGNQIGKSLFHMFGPLAIAGAAVGYVMNKFEEAAARIKDAVDFGGSLEKNAREAGVTIEMYQRMKQAAEAVGFSQEEINNAFKKSREIIVGAKDEHSKYFQILKALGFAKDDIIAGNIKEEEVLSRVAAAVNSTTDPIEKMRIATSAYGSDAEKLVQVLERWKAVQEALSSSKPITDPVAKILKEKQTKEGDEKAREQTRIATEEAVAFALERGNFSPAVEQALSTARSNYDTNGEGAVITTGMLARSPEVQSAVLADQQAKMDAEKAKAESEGKSNEAGRTAAAELGKIGDKTASATVEAFKSPEGFSNVVGVGANPVIEAMSKQLEAQLEANRILESIAAGGSNGAENDFTKNGTYHGDMSD